MPLYMDVHHLGEPVSVDDVAKAHLADLQHQEQVRREVPALLGRRGRTARSSAWSRRRHPDAANTVHREAHGLVADEVHRVQEGS